MGTWSGICLLVMIVCCEVSQSFAKPASGDVEKAEKELEKLLARDVNTDGSFQSLAGNFLNGPVEVPKIVTSAPLLSGQTTSRREMENMWNEAKELSASEGSLSDRFEKIMQRKQQERKKEAAEFDALKKRIVDRTPDSPMPGKQQHASGEESFIESKRFVETLSKRLADDFDKYFMEELAKEQDKRGAKRAQGGNLVAVGKRSKILDKKSSQKLVYVGRKDPDDKENNNNEAKQPVKEATQEERLDALRGLVVKYEDYLKRRHFPSSEKDKYSQELEHSSDLGANTVEHEEFKVPYAKHGKGGGFLDKTIEDISKRLKKLEKAEGIESPPQKVSEETEEILSGFTE